MFKKFMNSVMTFALVAVASWGIFGTGNSLLLFGEPEYPFEDR